MTRATFSCDLSQHGSELVHAWEHTVGSCHAPLALRADWQAQLRRCHDELGFQYVRFHGVLSDDTVSPGLDPARSPRWSGARRLARTRRSSIAVIVRHVHGSAANGYFRGSAYATQPMGAGGTGAGGGATPKPRPPPALLAAATSTYCVPLIT